MTAPPPLRRHLFRIGFRSWRRMEAGGIRLVGLACAAAVLTLGLTASVAAHATYAGMAARGSARTPVLVTPADPAVARLRWEPGTDYVAGREVALVYLDPLRPDAPLPPGLAHWPAPGAAVLSPALLRTGAHEGIATRYGTLAGTVGPDGLVSPGELLAYLRVRPGVLGQGSFTVSRFGAPTAGGLVFGDTLTLSDRPEWYLQLPVSLFVLFPGLVLTVLAVRVGARGRDRRNRLTAALGARGIQRFWMSLGEAAAPVLLGAAVGWIPYALGICTDLTVPYSGFRLPAADLRRAAGPAVLAAVAAAVLVAAVLAAFDLLSRPRADSVRPIGGDRVSGVWAGVCLVLVFLTVRVPDLFAPESLPRMLLNYAGVAGVLATLPAVLALAVTRAGGLIAAAGRRLGRPSMVVAGRRFLGHAGTTSRTIAGIVVAVVLLIQIQVWFGITSSTVVAAQDLQTRLGTGVVAITFPGERPAASRIDALLAALPGGAAAFDLRADPSRKGMSVLGPCPALTQLRLPCPGTPTEVPVASLPLRSVAFLGWYGSGGAGISVRVGDPLAPAADGDPSGSLFLTAPPGRDLDIPAVKSLAFRMLPTGALVSPAGAEYTAAAVSDHHQSRWIIVFGVVGLTALLLAAGLNALAESLRAARALAPVSVLTGRLSVQAAVVAWSLLLPLALAGGVGVVAGSWFAVPVVDTGLSRVSGTLVAACLAAVAAMALLFWAWGVGAATREAGRWRPGGESR